MHRTDPIAVIDSGIGGYTVAVELQRLLPAERIAYYCDSANMPYGGRPAAEILRLTRQILARVAESPVKALVVACNTISALIDEYRNDLPCEIISIIETGAAAILDLDASTVGLIGTTFTVKSGAWTREIARRRPDVTVVATPCPHIAKLVEAGRTAPSEVDPYIRGAIGSIQSRAKVKHLILACTHYPLVSGRIRALFPDLQLIDPGRLQAETVRARLAALDLLAPDGSDGTITINTSGDTVAAREAAERFGLVRIADVRSCTFGD